jgi:hypothetical protein
LIGEEQNRLSSRGIDCTLVAQQLSERFLINKQRVTGRQAVEVAAGAAAFVSTGAAVIERNHPDIAPEQLVPGAVGASALVVAATVVWALRRRPMKDQVEIADTDLLVELVVLSRTVCHWVFNVTHALWIEHDFGRQAGPILCQLADATRRHHMRRLLFRS